MNEYYAHAYLDDYQKIVVDIDYKFFDGLADKFYLTLNNNIVELEIKEVKEKETYREYILFSQDELEIAKEYRIVTKNNYSTPLIYRYIVKTERFNQEYYYDGDDLGALVKNNKTSFKVYAPTASDVKLVINEQTYSMIREDKGIYHLAFLKDLTGCPYHYLVKVNGKYNQSNDPYAKASLANSGDSIVTASYPNEKISTTKLDKYNDAVIYETNIADFSDEGTFKSFIKEIPYLKDLGITHLQLMPINDFGSVDEYHKDIFYNWGYDPVQYQTLEGSYGSNVDYPLQTIDQFKGLVKALHQNNIKVIIDVVFNHHYYALRSSFNTLVPYYYFRFNDNNELCDGTYCGSEFDSRQLMQRKYLIDTLKYYVNEFDIDGFRFDLMNFIDIETINEAGKQLRLIKDDIMLYGEGWDMQAGEAKEVLASYINADKLNDVAFFNDQFRDTINGSCFEVNKTGYGSGNVWLVDRAIEMLQSKRFNDVNKSINYVECHDNLTCFDKLANCCINESYDQLIERMKVINGCILLSKGIPFIHAGQEVANSKGNMQNTYNGPREINLITSEKRKANNDLYQTVKKLIALRKEYNLNDEDVTYSNSDGVIIGKKEGLVFVINPSINDFKLELEDEYEMIYTTTKDKNFFVVNNTFVVKSISIALFKRG